MPRISDRLAARIRTAWPMLLGYLAVRLLVVGAPIAEWLRATVGLEVTEPQVAAGLGIALGYLIYEAGRWLERRTGTGRLAQLARGAGRLLLSLGVTTGRPVYVQPGLDQQVVLIGPDGTMRRAR